ncbi:hypothetical protein N9P64_01330 [bacterium]|nr:hypothetical protein [bacterium]MDA9361249.1 hypothetical protein [Flavobacteriaceae bacterium]
MNENNNHIDPEKIHLEYIENVSVTMEEFELENQSNFSIATKIAHISGHNIEENKYLLGLKVVFSTTNLSKNLESKFRYNFHFSIDNLNEMYKLNKEGNPVFKKLFVATLAGISYSTLRGIIFEKTSNTNWKTLILPVINPSLILDSWIEKE